MFIKITQKDKVKSDFSKTAELWFCKDVLTHCHTLKNFVGSFRECSAINLDCFSKLQVESKTRQEKFRTCCVWRKFFPAVRWRKAFDWLEVLQRHIVHVFHIRHESRVLSLILISAT